MVLSRRYTMTGSSGFTCRCGGLLFSAQIPRVLVCVHVSVFPLNRWCICLMLNSQDFANLSLCSSTGNWLFVVSCQMERRACCVCYMAWCIRRCSVLWLFIVVTLSYHWFCIFGSRGDRWMRKCMLILGFFFMGGHVPCAQGNQNSIPTGIFLWSNDHSNRYNQFQNGGLKGYSVAHSVLSGLMRSRPQPDSLSLDIGDPLPAMDPHGGPDRAMPLTSRRKWRNKVSRDCCRRECQATTIFTYCKNVLLYPNLIIPPHCSTRETSGMFHALAFLPD